jgi:transcriptional regulator with XRE-family HTH domain
METLGFSNFDTARKIRQSIRPKLRLREMARKMNVSPTYLSELERGTRGIHGWPTHRKQAYIRILDEWRKNPTPRVRKKRTVKPKILENAVA